MNNKLRFMRTFVFVPLVIALWCGAVPAIFHLDTLAAWAKGGSDDDDSGSGSGSGGNSGSGSSNSGSGSSDDDDDDDDDGGGSGSGSSSGSGSGGSSGSGSRSDEAKKGRGSEVDFLTRDTIQIIYRDGHVERIVGNQFRDIAKNGKVRASRRATASDVARLRSIVRMVKDGRAQNDVEALVVVDGGRGLAEVHDTEGWHETLGRGVYMLEDPKGRTVRKRTLRERDLDRILDLIGID